MLDAQILKLVVGITTPIGLLSVLAYFYLTLQMRKMERSVKEVVEGEGLFNAEQVVRILEQFRDDTNRLSALKTLTNLDTSKTKEFLGKIKQNVDVNQLSRYSTANYRKLSITTAALFLAIGLAGIGYQVVFPDRGGQEVAASPPSAAPLSPAPDSGDLDAYTAIYYQRIGSGQQGVFTRKGAQWEEKFSDLVSMRKWTEDKESAPPGRIRLKDGPIIVDIEPSTSTIYYTDPGRANYPMPMPIDRITKLKK